MLYLLWRSRLTSVEHREKRCLGVDHGLLRSNSRSFSVAQRSGAARVVAPRNVHNHVCGSVGVGGGPPAALPAMDKDGCLDGDTTWRDAVRHKCTGARGAASDRALSRPNTIAIVQFASLFLSS